MEPREKARLGEGLGKEEMAVVESIVRLLEEKGYSVDRGLWVLEKSKEAVQKFSKCQSGSLPDYLAYLQGRY